MMPSRPLVPMVFPDTDAFIQQIRDQDAAWERLGIALGGFLSKAFPHASSEGFELGNAVIALGQVGSERQIKRIQTKPTAEDLAYLVEERDKIVNVLEQAEHNLEEIRDKEQMSAIAGIMELSMVSPLRNQLENIKERISVVQAEMEKDSTTP